MSVEQNEAGGREEKDGGISVEQNRRGIRYGG